MHSVREQPLELVPSYSDRDFDIVEAIPTFCCIHHNACQDGVLAFHHDKFVCLGLASEIP